MDFRTIRSLLNYQGFKCDKVENISNGIIKHLHQLSLRPI